MPTRKILGNFFDELVHASKPRLVIHNVLAITSLHCSQQGSLQSVSLISIFNVHKSIAHFVELKFLPEQNNFEILT